MFTIPERFHFVYPVGLIVLVSLILIGMWPSRSQDGRFEAILDRIVAAPAEEIDSLLKEEESIILFQSNGLSPKTGEESARPIADLYFLLGNALMTRPEPEYLDRSRACFETAAELYPSLRQGWIYFQLGQIYEQYEREDYYQLAKPYYEQVIQFNSGELALRAGFRIASIARQLNESPIASQPLYNYIRFASKDIAGDLSPFAEAPFDDRDETLYLRALIAQNRNDRDTAAGLWRQYLERRPTDYSARYQLARLTGASLSASYPENGDLLPSCFAPRAFQDGQLLLVHNHHIRSDFYTAKPDVNSLEISVDLENPFEKKLLLYVTVNDQIRSLTLEPKREYRESFRFDAIQERNLIDFHALMENGEPSPASPLWIRVRSLSTHLVSPEPPS